MSDKIEFVLELTREEALGLSLLYNAARGSGFCEQALQRVVGALQAVDPDLDRKQFDLFKVHRVSFELSDSVPLPKDWL